MRILYRYNPNNFVVRAEHRIEALRTLGHDVSASEANKDPAFAIRRLSPENKEPHIVVVQRMLATQKGWLETFKAVAARGWLMVSDMDDDPDLIHRVRCPEMTLSEFYQERMGANIFSHAMQTSNNRLAKRVKDLDWQDAIGISPNGIWATLPEKKWDLEKRRIRIAYGGSPRGQCFNEILPALKEIEQKFDVEWAFMSNPSFAQSTIDKLQPKHHDLQGLGPYDDYRQFLRTADICISPLSDVPEHHYKTDIKFLEAASEGAAFIGSPTVYAATVDQGRTGLIAKNHEEWVKAISTLINEPMLRAQMAHRALRYVRRERMLLPLVQKQVKWFEQLWTRKAELEALTLARAKRMLGATTRSA